MKKPTFLQIAERVLKEAGKPLTKEEIWKIAKDKGYDYHKRGKTPWHTIASEIYVSIRDNPDTPFVKLDTKPKTFYLRSLQKKI